MPRIRFFHDDDAFVLSQFPRKLALPDIHGKNFCRAMLQKAVRETAGGRAEVNGRHSGDVQLKMFERVFELVPAPADEFFRRVQRNFVSGFDGIARLARGLGIDANLPGEDGALGLFAAFTKAAFNQRLVEANHGIIIGQIPAQCSLKVRRDDVLAVEIGRIGLKINIAVTRLH